MKFYENMETVMKHYTAYGAFLSVSDGKTVNTMTVSWGHLGLMWDMPCWMVMVRPQRYTFAIIENAEDFTLSLPFGTMRDELTVCGTKSGRDIDKAAVVDFLPARAVKSPVVGGCDVYYECKIIYRDGFKNENMPVEIAKRVYGKNDFHSVYFGEILKQYGKTEGGV